MESERREGDSVREFRLEGGGLVLVSAVLVVALVGAFMVGRWYERSTQPLPLAGAGGADPLANVVEAEEPANLDQSSSYFDSMDGQGPQAEPQRQVVDESSKDREKAQAESPAESGGPFYVQVFAGRDRRAAESLVGQLQTARFPVRLFSDRSGQDSLFKVRVGGYGTDEEARAAAKTLVQQGYGGAWVTRVE